MAEGYVVKLLYDDGSIAPQWVLAKHGHCRSVTYRWFDGVPGKRLRFRLKACPSRMIASAAN
jgi:hypothetical protein